MISEYINQSASYYLSYVVPPQWLNKWVVAASILIFFVVVSKVFLFVVEKIILALTKKTKTNLDDLLIERTNKPVSWLLIFIGIRIALEFLALDNIVADYATKINNSIIYFMVIYLIAVVIVVFIDNWGMTFARKSKSKIDDILVPLFRKVTWVIATIGMAIFVLDLWGINISGILAGVGIAGLALGFAVKDSLGNIFGGISLIVSKTFHVGDKVEVEGHTGLIDEVGIRATRIKTFDNELIIVPNGVMANAIIKNYHQPSLSSRVVVPFGVEYGTKLEKLYKVIFDDVVKKMKDIEKDPAPQVVFKEMANSSLNFELRFWVSNVDDVFPKKFEANEKIYEALNKAKIGIPFPCVTVYKGK
ncbi:TPA: mechanosensitive ion channel family protein [Candidatus Woesearchaeota archaeon]|nr:mechanosensitive ion channel family protein [Candidatus Woesearchaeota archaeon]